ncbi:ABC transporter permease [Segetibacter sp. 3557_3]|uniref:ABC transporter permease n=1 Tax=Segetibacter sp. 3557_3 TaxID=2547429 RepID=UPI0010586346|nr:ABC transporter permease [Segetibacter sp. 3557_3]TDH28784.1 ABC transporter permease [Segetibacter sp. 3557_3]
MIRHYIKIAFRNLWKKKTFSLINIIGLSIGLTCCLLMAIYIRHELSYDHFQEKGDRIVRVIMEYSFGGAIQKGNFTSTKVAPSFSRNFPEVEKAVRMSGTSRVMRYEEKLFNEKSFVYADSTFLDIFSFKLILGNRAQALSGPNVVVFTKSAAAKYFGDENPVGKIVTVGSGSVPYTVTGVMEDCSSNSQIKFDFIGSFSSLGVTQENTYWDANFTTYLLLRSASAIHTLQPKIRPFMQHEMAAEVSGKDYVTYELEPFKDVHLYSPYDGFEPNNSITYIYIIAAVALLILAIACFTYINLSTARSIERAKEVGIRKVAGAFKNQIFWQFIGESLVISVAALLISTVLACLLLQPFNNLADRNLAIGSLFSPAMLLFELVVILCITLLAGSYPAVILSGFQPIRVLKGAFKNSGTGLVLRKSLIVFQFIISVFLIVACFVIQKQLEYIRSKNLGFDRDHIVVLPMDQKMKANIATVKTVFTNNPGIRSVARVNNEPINIVAGYSMRRADMAENQSIIVNANVVDEDFAKTTGVHFIAGEDFSEQDMKDVEYEDQEKKQYHYILNETAARELGWTPAQAIGKKMFLGTHRPGTVKGVIKDFHFSSFHNPIKPLVLFNENWGNYLLVKLSGENMQQTIEYLESSWKNLVPHRPFEFHFLDDNYNKLYNSEHRLGKVLNTFAAIAVLLAMLGLFGLSAYVIQQRNKEIGIRKVLGASVANVVALLSKDFLQLVIAASLIAFPLAWLVMNKWLQDFTFRVSVGVWIFVAAAFLIIAIALITVSFQAIKAAVSNPVKSLRTE